MAYRPQVKTSNGMVDLPIDAETIKGKTLLEQTYPVGAIYMSVDNSVSPASLFGGSWEALNSGNKVYIANGDVPVDMGDIHSVSGNKLYYRAPNGGVVTSGNYVLGLESGKAILSTSSTLSPTHEVVIGNLWSKNSNSTYNTGFYMWKRVPD